MSLFHSAVALLILAPSFCLAADNFGKVELSLGQWQETMDRLAKAEAPKVAPPATEPEAPCAAIITSAICEVSYLADGIRLTTDFEVEIINPGWIVLPLADASAPIISSQVSEGRLIVRERAYALVTNKTGKVKIRLVQEQPSAAESQEFWLAAATSTQAHLGAVADPNMHYSLNDARLTAEPMAVSSGESGRTMLRLQRSLAAAAEKVAPAPGLWQSRSETQVAYEDGRLNYDSRVVLLCSGGDDQKATLVLPSECIILQAEGDDLEKWESTPGTDGNVILLTWKKAGLRQRVVQLEMAMVLPNIVGEWPLISAQVPGREATDDVWQITAPLGLQQAIPKEQPLTASLSNWMRTRLADNDSPAFQAVSGNKVEVSILKTLALAEARIDSAKFSTELAAGGGMLTDARLEIATSQKTTVDLTFEKDVRIISCRVAGQKQNPADLGNGRIQLDVPGSEQVAVELTFSQQLPAFDPASGQVRLTMPRTSLLTKTGGWSIRLPAGLALNTFDGSVIADSAGSNGELRFRQELYRDTPPLAVLFYQKVVK